MLRLGPLLKPFDGYIALGYFMISYHLCQLSPLLLHWQYGVCMCILHYMLELAQLLRALQPLHCIKRNACTLFLHWLIPDPTDYGMAKMKVIILRPTSSFIEVSAKAGQPSILKVQVNRRIIYWLRTSVVRRMVLFFLQEHAHISIELAACVSVPVSHGWLR